MESPPDRSPADIDDGDDGDGGLICRWLVPGILVTVAVVQVGLAFTTELSPWKGGGFGMFAVVDSPDMRVLRIDGTTEGGRTVRLDPADFLGEEGWDSLRAWPLRRQLEPFGRELLETPLVPYGSRHSAALARLGEGALPEGEPDAGRGGELWLRPLRPSDPPELVAQYLSAIDLSWWRMEYEPTGHRLVLRRIGGPVSLQPTTESPVP